jgi:glycosyltransferase involved in cell wall biosynthesis
MGIKISIISAVYNRIDTIARAINSVHAQDYGNIEHVIVDGQSSDGTLSIIKNMLDSRSVLISEPDDGIYDALNKGLLRSTGDVIGFMHSDDLYYNTAILSDVSRIFSNLDVDIVYGDAVFFAKDKPDQIVRKYHSGIFSVKRLAWGWMPSHPSMFIHKRVYEKNGLFKTNYKIAADYEFLCRIMSRADLKIFYVREVFVKMQIGGASTGGISSTLQLNKEVLRACRENHIYSNMLMILSKYPAKMLQYMLR